MSYQKYNPELLDKERLVAISKSDMLDGGIERIDETGIGYVFWKNTLSFYFLRSSAGYSRAER